MIRRIPWQPEEIDRLVEMIEAKTSLPRMAAALNRSISSVKHRLDRMGPEYNRQPRYTREELVLLYDAVDAGTPTWKILQLFPTKTRNSVVSKISYARKKARIISPQQPVDMFEDERIKKANRHGCAMFLQALINAYGPPRDRQRKSSDEAAAILLGCRMTQYGSEQRRTYGGVSA